MPAKLRVFLVDDHAVLREGLALFLNAQSDIEVVGQASDGMSAFQEIQTCQPDLALVDISLPQMNGMQLTAQIIKHCPQIMVVVLSRHAEAGYVRQLLQAGARGYVLKQAAPDDLLSAIRAVSHGGTYLDPTITATMLGSSNRSPIGAEAGGEMLSDREQEVVRLLAHGYSNKEIANQLALSVKTVDTYKARAMEKLGLHSRAALVRYAVQRGWLDQFDAS